MYASTAWWRSTEFSWRTCLSLVFRVNGGWKAHKWVSWTTSRSSFFAQPSLMVQSEPNKGPMIAVLEKGNGTKAYSSKKLAHGRWETQRYPILPPFPCGAKKVISPPSYIIKTWILPLSQKEGDTSAICHLQEDFWWDAQNCWNLVLGSSSEYQWLPFPKRKRHMANDDDLARRDGGWGRWSIAN